MDDDIPIFTVSQSQTLGRRLLDSFAISTFDARKQDYLPESAIKELVTAQSIREVLQEPLSGLKLTDQELLVQWILDNAKKLFAITLECDIQPRGNMLSSLRVFRKQKFGDSHLPIDNPRNSGSENEKSSQFPMFHPQIWPDLKLYDFYEKQWKYLAPVFTPDEYDYDLSSERIFPFELQIAEAKQGAFSRVYKCKIHNDHQQHHEHDIVAIKEIKVSKGGADKNGTNEAWEIEAKALRAINRLDHPHIVKCIAAIRRGDSRYFMFKWADGDSLRDFWIRSPKRDPDKGTIQQTIIQLRGIADALDKLHNFHPISLDDSEVGDQRHGSIPEVKVEDEVGEYTDPVHKESIRHGDLKPENLLRFDATEDLGNLKIADMGLAKRHVVATQDRTHHTSMRYGTIMYEAPETVTAIQGRSRLYDIWSMGCITLEFIIWILYGNDELENFYKQLKGDGQQTCQFFEVLPNETVVNRVAVRWMDHIKDNDPVCSQGSAICDLLDVVRNLLLVVPLSPRRASNMNPGPLLSPPVEGHDATQYRATASEFRDALDSMLEKMADPHYLLAEKPRMHVKTPDAKSDLLLSVNGMPRGNMPIRSVGNVAGSGAIGRPSKDYTVPPLKDWEFIVDNDFASKVLDKVGKQALHPVLFKSTKLCSRCIALKFWVGGFTFEDTLTELMARASSCDLCTWLYSVGAKPGVLESQNILFERSQSTLKLASGSPLPILSLVKTDITEDRFPFQVGFPELPKPGSRVFFQIIRTWLDDCDDTHKDCEGLAHSRLPTRLIDVGSVSQPMLQLLETQQDQVENHQYIALSHPWGDPKKHPPFRTLRVDDSGKGHDHESFKRSIPFEQLPATFKDAVLTTRALNIRYLWIDSICIVQGPGGDFNEESKRMEDVFSGAYCVIAASRATGQTDGFLGSRAVRDYVTFQQESNKPFYVCQPIDNFSFDVLEGSLNRRGWVLQERALARRTIFFTKTQTYFECGNGIRCETLTKMHNNMADFLGDPKFPEKAKIKTRGLQIHYFQDLYEQYSRLGFTTDEDRPIAIAGIENRLKKAFEMERGRYGIFDDGPGGGIFHRSLLWRRGEDEETMIPISFSAHRNLDVPTWSWMAYKGGINYLDPDFKTADWERNEIRPAWGSTEEEKLALSAQTLEIGLIAVARDFNVAGRLSEDVVTLVYDTEKRGSNGQLPQCVIVARSTKGETENEKTHFVLIVAVTSGVPENGRKIYERIGAGKMLGKYIKLEEAGTTAIIR